jgi:predicted amidohydrolase YtcJ
VLAGHGVVQSDLVIREKNLFAVEALEIKDVAVLGSMMDGKFTHREGL